MLIDFKNHLQAKGFDSNYFYRIKPFLTFCEENKIDYYNIKLSELNQFLLYLRTKKLQNGTINNFINALRNFYKFLSDNKFVGQKVINIIYKIKLVKYERKIKDYITEEELSDLIEMGISFCNNIQPIKIQAILYFLFYTGLRKNEILNLKRKDIDLKEKTVIVRIPTKNKVERIVFFPEKVNNPKVNNPKKDNKIIPITTILYSYFESEPEEKNAFNITSGKLSYLIHNLKAFVPNKNLTIHTFRHSFARMLASKQIDSRIAQKLLGHKNIESTMIYYDPDIDVIKKIYNEKIR